MNKKFLVYVHINKVNGKRYYGITSQRPKNRWARGKGYSNNEHFTNSINKYGWDGFDHVIVARGLTEDEAKWLEIKMIAAYDTNNQKFGYNQTPGGDMISEEHRHNLSEFQKGENNSFYGKTHTDEAKRIMSETRKGKGNARAKAVICITTGRIFFTAKEAAQYYNIKGKSDISKCCKGTRKSCGNLNGQPLKWRYVNCKHNKTYRIA